MLRSLFDGLARLFPASRHVEFGRIGRYYASESMLVWDEQKQRYDADATPSYGTDTLEQFFERVARDGMAGQDLGMRRFSKPSSLGHQGPMDQSTVDPAKTGRGRNTGVLLHPTALPGSPVSGSFAEPCRRWLRLAAQGIGVWQMLPLAPPDPARPTALRPAMP